ncbi:MAG: DUF3341 domain-containing protein [Chloroflexi bacterium]|nr:DUF3341 domain-containing protein [Chloroflexota bacterium]
MGLFAVEAAAADATRRLREVGFTRADYEVLSGTPFPPGAFGEAHPRERLWVFPLMGAICGFAVGLLITAGTQLAYPLVTHGKPILSIPPMVNIMYEGTLLGAIILTVIGIIFESRLPDLNAVPYDPRISEGYVGVVVTRPEGRAAAAEQVFRETGAADIIRAGGG